MQTVNCPKCRSRISSQARQCPFCGSLLAQDGAGKLAASGAGSCGPLANAGRTAGCTAGCLGLIVLFFLMALLGNLRACQQFSPFRQALEDRQDN